MNDSFIRVGAATPKIKVADCEYNAVRIIELIEEGFKRQVKLLVFPELCITSYTCGDLFLQDVLIQTAKEQLNKIIKSTDNKDMIVAVGLPFMKQDKLYNVAAVIHKGKLLGIVPKQHIPNYSEFYEARHFTGGNLETEYIKWNEDVVAFGTNLLFRCSNMNNIILGLEICEDLWVPVPPSSSHALAGATIIANLSASVEVVGKDTYRRELVKGQSSRLISGYIYADAGEGESTTDLVYSGHNLIAENGTLLKESKRFTTGLIYSEIDLDRIVNERRRTTTFVPSHSMNYQIVEFEFDDMLPYHTLNLSRKIDKAPFIPSIKKERDNRCEEIISLQAFGLKKRLEHIGCKCAVVGVSGGLDSTLALLVTAKAFDLLGLGRQHIIAITMPCFGTTDRTYQNALTLAHKLGASVREIPITEAVLLHLRDINHDSKSYDVTYENAQARERTQVLMDVANQYNGLVIGTGDMSELALGWATYNGDHMSMYGVNSSVPKTLVRYLVSYFAELEQDQNLKTILLDILDTPVSPELLPPQNGEISQKTEDIVGPYELHDFFLYYVLRYGFSPSKVFYLANCAFNKEYEEDVIYKWLTMFYKRFFSQQFKRSCLPDGPKVGSVGVSPRGDLRMPSDACAAMWIKDLEACKPNKN